jgi:iron complex transport system substrate-binding protein
MKRMIWLNTSVLLLLAGCGGFGTHQTTNPLPAETTNPSIVITDALGREVILQVSPQRIIITGKALIMIADAVYTFPEAPKRIIALGKTSQGTGNFIALIDPAYVDKSILEQDASAEQIAAIQPDLVILKSYLAETTGKPIELLGIPVVYVDFETPEQYTRDLAILGKVFQNDSRAQEVTDYYQSTIDRIQIAVEGVEIKPTVLMLYYSDRDGIIAFNVPPLSWMQTRLVEMAGGTPVWSDANPGEGWTQVSLEQIAAWDTDQIFIISYNTDSSDVVARLMIDPNWKSLRSVQEGHLYAFPSDLTSWDQPDTRWVLGLSWLAGRLHPERFPNLDIINEAKQFYQTLYGLDQAFFNQNILPTFKGDLP